MAPDAPNHRAEGPKTQPILAVTVSSHWTEIPNSINYVWCIILSERFLSVSRNRYHRLVGIDLCLSSP